MVETDLSPIHNLPSGLGENPSGEGVALIRRMANQDPAALVELYGIWSPVLLGVACRMLGDRREAEDVVQDTFVRLWQGAALYDPHQAPPWVWAYVVMRSNCIARLRRRRHAKRDSSRIVQVNPHVSPVKHDNPRVMPVDDFRRVRAALDNLAPDERSCLELAVFLECPVAELTDHADTPAGSVKNRLRQALKKVRNHLSRYEL